MALYVIISHSERPFSIPRSFLDLSTSPKMWSPTYRTSLPLAPISSVVDPDVLDPHPGAYIVPTPPPCGKNIKFMGKTGTGGEEEEK